METKKISWEQFIQLIKKYTFEATLSSCEGQHWIKVNNFYWDGIKDITGFSFNIGTKTFYFHSHCNKDIFIKNDCMCLEYDDSFMRGKLEMGVKIIKKVELMTTKDILEEVLVLTPTE